ncbi:MAG: aspartate kinase, partial [Pirellulales bacterium]
MPLIVQKFGGTSVADSAKILAAARKAVRARQEGNQVVMVVSAMGKNTDLLVDLANQISDDPPAREMDMLLSTGEQVSVALMAMAIDSLGQQAISFTGAQIGIKTDSTHTKARIQSISTDRMRKALAEGKIVIAAGFQGIDEDYNITTLGRGGSDTTAVALAAVLGADACEIYTDVDGVYTTDPRVLPEARMVKQVSYDEMLELASLGAGVMHSRSIEFAKKFSVPIHVRNSSADVPGTMIVPEPEAEGQPVSGATLVKNEARVTILGVPDRPGSSLAIFSKIAAKNISVDMIVQNIGSDSRADVSFTVFRDDLPSTLKAVSEAAVELGAEGFTHDDNVSKVSVVGLGMATQTGVAQRMFRALADGGVNIQMITTSEIKISVLVAREQGFSALRTVHGVFELDREPAGPRPPSSNVHPRVGDAAAVVARLQGMENLTIS